MFIQKRVLLGSPLAGLMAAFGFSVTAMADTPITIVNNLDQPLTFVEIKNREHIKIISDPPREILAHSSGKFKIKVGDTVGSRHVNIKYDIKDSDGGVGVVYKRELKVDGWGESHCPKEAPDWVIETVERCGNWDSSSWTYTFDKASQ